MTQGGGGSIIIGNGSESGAGIGSSDKSKGLFYSMRKWKKQQQCLMWFIYIDFPLYIDDTTDDDDDDQDDDDDDDDESQQFSIPFMLQSPDAGNIHLNLLSIFLWNI